MSRARVYSRIAFCRSAVNAFADTAASMADQLGPTLSHLFGAACAENQPRDRLHGLGDGDVGVGTDVLRVGDEGSVAIVIVEMACDTVGE